MTDDRLLKSLKLMRQMLTSERAEAARLREENNRLRGAAARHGLDIERILS